MYLCRGTYSNQLLSVSLGTVVHQVDLISVIIRYKSNNAAQVAIVRLSSMAKRAIKKEKNSNNPSGNRVLTRAVPVRK